MKAWPSSAATICWISATWAWPPGCWRAFPRKSPTPFWRSWGGRTPPPSGISAPGGAFPRETADRLETLALLYGPPEEVLPRLAGLVQGQTAEAAVRELEGPLRPHGRHGPGLPSPAGLLHRQRHALLQRPDLPGVPAGAGQRRALRRAVRQPAPPDGPPGRGHGLRRVPDQLERLETEEPSYDVDTLLLYGPEDRPSTVAERAAAILTQGRSVRAERHIPQGVRFRTTERVSEGGEL